MPRDEDVYLVEDDLGRLDCVWIEADSNAANLETVLSDMMARQYSNPVRVVVFNASEGWSRDVVSEDLAIELRRRCEQQGDPIPTWLEEFIERHQETRRA